MFNVLPLLLNTKLEVFNQFGKNSHKNLRRDVNAGIQDLLAKGSTCRGFSEHTSVVFDCPQR